MSEIHGIILKDEEGYCLWSEIGLLKKENEAIHNILKEHVNEGGCTSPCLTMKELIEEMQELHNIPHEHGKVSLLKQNKDLYPLDISCDEVYRIVNENQVPIGIICLSDYPTGDIYIEWLEFLYVFRGKRYLRKVFEELSEIYPNTTFQMQCSEENLRRYIRIGCIEHGIDECTELYVLTYKKRGTENSSEKNVSGGIDKSIKKIEAKL